MYQIVSVESSHNAVETSRPTGQRLAVFAKSRPLQTARSQFIHAGVTVVAI